MSHRRKFAHEVLGPPRSAWVARPALFVLGALALALAGLVAACSLNPQPLPPGDDDERNAAAPTGAPTTGGDFAEGGQGRSDAAQPPMADAAATPEGGRDASPDADAAADADATSGEGGSDAGARD